MQQITIPKTYIQQSVTCHIDEVIGCGLSILQEDVDPNKYKSISFNGGLTNHSASFSSDALPMISTSSLLSMSNSDYDISAAQRGYKILHKICDTLQGQLLKAEKIRLTPTNYSYESVTNYVAIKKISKELHYQHITCRGDINFCVGENIKKEAIILKFITVDNKLNGIVQFLDYFESESHLYLVTEYINGMDLKQFVHKAYLYIINGKLELKEYVKIIKFIMWQLSAILVWLHEAYHCTHLDLWMENIMVNNVEFIENSDGSVNIHGAMNIKLIDFGNAEIFMPNEYFTCNKSDLTVDNEMHQAPELHYDANYYNPKAIDIFCLGVIFYECMTGESLFIRYDTWKRSIGSKYRYWDASKTSLRQYLTRNNLLKVFKNGSVCLLEGLLQINQNKRFTISDVVQTKWLSKYYKKYGEKMKKK
eukprot:342406_1